MQTLKAEIRKLYQLYELLTGYWNKSGELFPVATIVSVLLQNAQYEITSYSNVDKEYQNLLHIQRCLNALAEYDKTYVTTFPASELNQLLQAFDNEELHNT